MKPLIALIIALALPSFAAPKSRAASCASGWKVYKFGNNGLYKGTCAVVSGGDVATFEFPQSSANAYPAFLTTTTDASLLGDLTGKTLSATLTVEATPGTMFRFGGQGTSWNQGSAPANARLYFSTNPSAYNLVDAQFHQDDYWWSNSAWVVVNDQTGTVTLTDTFDPAHFSNAQGGQATNRLAAFQAAVANVQQIGVSYGGGSFYDVGLAVFSGTGTASFHLLSYTAQ